MNEKEGKNERGRWSIPTITNEMSLPTDRAEPREGTGALALTIARRTKKNHFGPRLRVLLVFFPRTKQRKLQKIKIKIKNKS